MRHYSAFRQYMAMYINEPIDCCRTQQITSTKKIIFIKTKHTKKKEINPNEYGELNMNGHATQSTLTGVVNSYSTCKYYKTHKLLYRDSHYRSAYILRFN